LPTGPLQDPTEHNTAHPRTPPMQLLIALLASFGVAAADLIGNYRPPSTKTIPASDIPTGCTKWCTAGGYHTPGYSCTVSGHCQVDNSCGTGSYCRYPYNPNGQNSMYACAPAFCAAHSDGRTCTQTLNRGPAGTTAQVACTGAQHATQGACAQQLTAVQQQHLIGAFVPQCDAAGHFEPLQCHGSTGACWCVDTATGVEVPNTRGQATVASCQATAPPGCTTYFDGCNTCTRPDVTSAMTCTMMYCMQPGPAVCRGWAAGWDEAEGGH